MANALRCQSDWSDKSDESDESDERGLTQSLLSC